MEDIFLVHILVDSLIGSYDDAKSTDENFAGYITEEILRNIKEVLRTKQIFIDQRWKAMFNKFPEPMYASLETYITYVIYACQEEATVNLNIFERFLGVLCLLILIIEETLKRTEVNLSIIIPRIFMVMFRREMKEAFCRRGGFRRFVDYINNPKYLEMRRIADCLDSSCISNGHFPESLRRKIEKLQREETGLSAHFNLEKALEDTNSRFWARNILTYLKIEHPPFSTNTVMKAILYEVKMAQLDKEKTTLGTELSALEESLERFSRLLPDFETDGEVRQMADKARFESIIEAVIKCNRSRSSDHVNKNNRKVQKETENILELVRDKIMTLIEIVDKYENE